MTHRVAGAPLDFAALRRQLEVPGDFSSDVLADAAQAAAAATAAAMAAASTTRSDVEDATDIPFVTIDPAGSMDLDQAIHIGVEGDGWLVSYAIADVAEFVVPGSALDAETHRRVETLYFPDARVPLHPPQLSEGAASLLPDQTRSALLWRMHLDGDARVVSSTVTRARVRSTARLDYVGVQQAADTRRLPDAIVALPDVGTRRLALARERHAVNLDLPEQIVESDGAGGWTISLRDQSSVERYNAEISLMTGMCAAQIMLDGGYGVLRTVPPPDPRAVAALRRAAGALGISWPDGTPAGDVLASLDRADPRQMAVIEHAVTLLRGAAYTVFDGATPEQPLHAGIGAPYAHVTAPLRRLVDRYTGEICLALSAGKPIPDSIRATVPDLPGQMQRADRLAHEVDRAVVDATEAWLLRDQVGNVFAGVVIDADERAGTIVLDRPAVRARCVGIDLPVGERIAVRLVVADVEERSVRFERVSDRQ